MSRQVPSQHVPEHGTGKRIRRGTFHNVKQLQQAITNYIDEHNEKSKAFKWTAKAERILAKVRRARTVLNKMPTECITTLA